MNRHLPGEYAAITPTGARAHAAVRWLLVTAMTLASIAPVQANEAENVASPGDAYPAALTDDPLAHDPGFAGGTWFRDAFAGAASNYYLGRRIVRLGNGDTVSAGLVPQVGAANVPGRFHLGLVRYNAAGQRLAWANPGGNGHYGNQYVVFAYANVNTPGVTEVVDIVASETAQDRIYVLLNYHFGDQTSAAVAAFTHGGAFVDIAFAFDTPAHETGAGLVYYREGLSETYKLVVIGNRFETTKGRPVYRRYNVSTGSLVSEEGPRDIHPAQGPCSINTQTGGCIATAVTSVQWAAFDWLPPRIYVAGVVTHNAAPDSTNFFVTRIKGGDGTGVGHWDPSFGSGGTREVAFDAGSNNRDYVTGVAARRGPADPAQPLGNNTGDRVFVTGQVAQTCTPGIGVVALNHNGTLATGFGNNGMLRFGGQSLSCNQYVFESADFANNVTYSAGQLVIVGFSAYERICFPVGTPCEDAVDPMVAIVRDRDGMVRELRDFPVQPGNRTMHGGLYDVVATGPGQYAATGDARYHDSHAQYPGRQEFITGRLRLDRIFGNGADCGGGFPDPSWAGCN